MADLNTDYRTTLEAEFTRRKERNSRYSLRAFARFLGVDVSYLSKLRGGRLMLSVDLAASFSERLRLGEKERREFILSAADEQRCHALYLFDPSLTDCDPACEADNLAPRPRAKKPTREP